ncbi:hypothetical protein N473_18085 [Pseudoalteromonas luteoviolacea CPMOR-1]|uniref:Uncharacterized protein n=1 Tax=Pseudoalteromonas luteoviolacea CPMOR-1 TaxID=1365248 RepID=A0A161YMC4_9GAMM|nr:hypothetical protein N473_18085 [Pseudoalteromonas luteoviolacea CPMOR-1]
MAQRKQNKYALAGKRFMGKEDRKRGVHTLIAIAVTLPNSQTKRVALFKFFHSEQSLKVSY